MLRPVAVNPALSDLLGEQAQGLALTAQGSAGTKGGHRVVEVGDRRYGVTLRSLAPPGDAPAIVIATFVATQPDLASEDAAPLSVRELEQRLRLALQAGGFGFWENDLGADRVRYDPAFLARHGWGADRFDLPMHAVRERIHPRDRARVRSVYNQCRRGERSLVRVEYRVRRHDGSYAWVEEHATVAERDSCGVPLRLIGMSADISARKETEQRLAHLALHDHLTGLPNRRALGDALDRALARAQRSGLALAVLALDLNGFKAINDRHGHPAGDAVLAEIAARLRRTVRRSDIVARLGGDEFAVIAGELKGPHPVVRLARRLGQVLAEPIELPAGKVRVGVSTGVAFFPADGETPELLLGRADRALYAAKRDGVGWRLCAELAELEAAVER
jgi:diguanylate cyclase (GGDEF)-like protein/PAS domain S-box-containing protein